MNYIYPPDPMLNIASGAITGHSAVHVFGRNPEVPKNIAVTLWDTVPGGKVLFPTAARVHQVASDNAGDTGTLISSGAVSTGGVRTVVDAAATFVTDGVAARDAIINDTGCDYGVVTEVTSETTLTVATRYNVGFAVGDLYRVVHAVSSGASLCLIRGLDANMDYAAECVLLQGLTPVATVRPYWRINHMYVTGTGSVVGSSNDGKISATAEIDGTITASIAAERGTSQQAIYTVGRGHSFFMTQWFAALDRGIVTNAGMVDIKLKKSLFAPNDGAGMRVVELHGMAINGSSSFSSAFLPYRFFPENTDIKINITDSTDADMDVSGGFSGILVKNIQI